MTSKELKKLLNAICKTPGTIHSIDTVDEVGLHKRYGGWAILTETPNLFLCFITSSFLKDADELFLCDNIEFCLYYDNKLKEIFARRKYYYYLDEYTTVEDVLDDVKKKLVYVFSKNIEELTDITLKRYPDCKQDVLNEDVFVGSDFASFDETEDKEAFLMRKMNFVGCRNLIFGSAYNLYYEGMLGITLKNAVDAVGDSLPDWCAAIRAINRRYDMYSELVKDPFSHYTWYREVIKAIEGKRTIRIVFDTVDGNCCVKADTRFFDNAERPSYSYISYAEYPNLKSSLKYDVDSYDSVSAIKYNGKIIWQRDN